MTRRLIANEHLKRIGLVMTEPNEYTQVLTEFIGKELNDILQDYPDYRITQIDTDTKVNFIIEIEEGDGTKTLCLESDKCVQAFFFLNE